MSILSASLVVVSGGAIAANIPAMAETFADVPLQTVEMLSTIPSLFIIISVLMSNLFARYLGYNLDSRRHLTRNKCKTRQIKVWTVF